MSAIRAKVEATELRFTLSRPAATALAAILYRASLPEAELQAFYASLKAILELPDEVR